MKGYLSTGKLPIPYTCYSAASPLPATDTVLYKYLLFFRQPPTDIDVVDFVMEQKLFSGPRAFDRFC